MSTPLITQVKAARRVSVPLVAITTPDPGATIDGICGALKPTVPQLVWDVVEGVRGRPGNDPGKEAAAKLTSDFDPTIGNPAKLLEQAKKLPPESILFVHLANRWLEDAGVVQAAWNLRDAFKVDHRTLVLLGPSIALPPELAGDVIVLDEPLPDATALEEIVRAQEQSLREAVPDVSAMDAATLGRSVEAVQGLPAFQAEQVVAMSLTGKGIDVPALWERKRRQIELTPGLKVHRDPVRFSDIGGVATVKTFLGRILAGQARPNAVVFIDEIEKHLAGAGASGSAGDSSGVSQDQLGTLLSYMQDQAAAGCIFVGPPGSAKSMVAKATGNEAGIPTIQLDLGAMKGSLVGQSEQNLRAGLKVVTSVSNGQSLWIATCNGIGDLPPELRRRFTLGTFFFDLPSVNDRHAIWNLWLNKFSLKGPVSQVITFDDDGWTGAEIKQCCDIAWRLGCTPAQAAQFVVPVSRSAAEQLERLRKAAEGRFLSASNPGVYVRPGTNGDGAAAAAPKRRRLAMAEE